MKNVILACLCISLCDDFDFPLFATFVTVFVDVRFTFGNSITDVYYENKIIGLSDCEKCSVTGCVRVIALSFSDLLKS